MTRLKNKKIRDGRGMVVPVNCRGDAHEVFVHRNGGVVFLNHPGVKLKTLAAEYEVTEVEQQKHCGCALLASAVQGNMGVPALLPVWFMRHLEAGPWKRRNERSVNRSKGFDWISSGTVLTREPKGCYLAALRALSAMKFRTTNTTGSIVEIQTAMGKQESAILECVGVAGGPLAGKKAAVKRKQRVKLRLNLKQWARVWKYDAGLVDDAFVLRVFKVKCDNELVVDMLHQSTGYKVVIKRVVIRRDHAGIWRVHAEA